MEPVKIYLHNFLSYKEEEVSLDGVRLAALVGPNGSGKSSLLDSLLYGLFGQGTKGGARDLDNYVTRGETEGRVELEFRLNGGTYRVIRGRSIARNKSTLEFFVLDGERWRPISGKTLAETQKVIEETLRMDYRTFTASSLILQGQADAFTANMTDAERKEALSRILGLDIWDRLQEQAREKIRNLKGELASLEAQTIRFREQVEASTGLKQQYDSAKAALDDYLWNIAELEPAVAEMEARLRQRPALTERLKDIQRDLARKEQEVLALQDEIEKARRQIKSAHKEIASRLEILAMREEINAAVEMEAEFAEEVAEFDRQAQEYMRLQSLAAELDRKVSAWEKETETEIARLESSIQAYSDQAATLNKVPCSGDVKAKCPLLAKAKKAASEVVRLQGELEKLHKMQNPHVEAWQKACRERDAIGYDAGAHQAARRALEDVRKTARMKPEFDAAEKRVQDLIDRNQELEESISIWSGKIQSLQLDQEDLKTQRDMIQAEMAELDPMAYELKNKQIKLQTLRQNEAKVRTELGRMEQQLIEAEKAQEELKRVESDMSRIREDLAVYEILDQACGKKAGVPALIVENAVPEIERLANNMLSKMAGGRLAVRLDTQVEGKSTGTMQEVLRVTVLDGGVERPYQTYSGAERFMVDLALRVALSKFLAHRAGAEIKLFVLDEGLGACDAANRQAVMDAIQAVSEEFGKVIVVTHLAELQDAFPQRIEVTKGPEGSKVKVA